MGDSHRTTTRPWLLALLVVLALTSVPVRTQSASQTTLLLRIGPECSIVNSTNISIGQDDAVLQGVTQFRYKLRTSGLGGAAIQLRLNRPGAKFTYSVHLPAGAPSSGSQTIPESGILTVANFGPDAHSSKDGDLGTLSWSLPNEPGEGVPPLVFSITCR